MGAKSLVAPRLPDGQRHNIKPTHYFITNDGLRIEGVPIAPATYGGWHFLCLCNDGKTWMKETVYVNGIREIDTGDENQDEERREQ